MRFVLCLIPIVAFSLTAMAAHADTLLIERLQQERGLDLPARGLSMAQVERRYGAPPARLAPAGGDSRRHPIINRWRYANYTVYFERNRVINTVVDRVSSDEIGPKNAADAPALRSLRQ